MRVEVVGCREANDKKRTEWGEWGYSSVSKSRVEEYVREVSEWGWVRDGDMWDGSSESGW